MLKKYLNYNSRSFPSLIKRFLDTKQKPIHQGNNFGILFDIDGVVIRDGNALPSARRALQRLVDTETNSFNIPFTFVTNAGNMMRKDKAYHLSQLLDMNITADHILMSHSPLKMFKNYHKKRVLLSGQGPAKDIAQSLGFEDYITTQELAKLFPYLDRVDARKRQSFQNVTMRDAPANFRPIEAIVMFGEPIQWECSLQLLIDVLLTNGTLAGSDNVYDPPYPHLPILVCNLDFLWLAQVDMPRFGHGAFLHCLEELYKKLSGYDLRYNAYCGKPSTLTYHHALNCINEMALKMGRKQNVSTLYCIGDSLHTDICGANLYDHYISTNPKRTVRGLPRYPTSYSDILDVGQVSTCYSIFVKSGVCRRSRHNLNTQHSHRDFKSSWSNAKKLSSRSAIVLVD